MALNKVGLAHLWAHIVAKLGTKVDKVDGKGLSTNDYTTEEKNKLAGIADGANKTIVDTALSTSSTNPVQNKVVSAEINSLNTLVGDTSVATQISDAIANKVDKINGKGLSTNDYTTTEKNKLAGIAPGAEVNQNAFSNVVVGSTTIVADGKTDTLTIAAGNNVTITPDATNDKITIAATDTVYTHPTYDSKSSGLYKVEVDSTGHVSGATTVVKSDITALGIPAQDTTYSTATTSDDGLMSSTDKSKLDGVESGANKTTVDSSLSSTSTNPVQNKVVNTAISNLNTLVGDTAVSEQISNVIASTKYAGSSTVGGAATSANKLTTARTISLTGDATGSVSFDGSDNASITTSVISESGITTSGDGSAYTATVPGITSLTAGVSFIMIPHVVSASTAPTLNVNGLGAKTIRRRLSSLSTSVQAGYTSAWLSANTPFRVTYDGTQWVVEGLTKPAAADLYGTLAINKGGTGATDADGARTNIGAVNIAGDTMTGNLSVPQLLICNSYPELRFQDAEQNTIAGLALETSNHAFSVRVKTVDANYSEYYHLPDLDTGRTDDGWYKFLTTKNTVTVAQGGTGVTSIAGLRGQLHYYTELSELGLTAPVTIEQVWSAMGDNAYAILQGYMNGNDAVISDLPNKWSMVEIMKTGNWLGVAKCYPMNGGTLYYQSHRNSSAETWTWYGYETVDTSSV